MSATETITLDIHTPHGSYPGCRVKAARFIGGQVRLDAANEEGPIARITTSLLEAGVDPQDELAIKDQDENEGLVGSLVAARLVEPPHRQIDQGYVTYRVCRPAGALKALIAALPPVPAKKAKTDSKKRAAAGRTSAVSARQPNPKR
jgi:hypothetical protein